MSPAGRDASIGRSLIPMGILTLVWGVNWPILKMGVTEVPPLTFRAYTLLFTGLCLLAVARAGGESIRLPRELWPLVVRLSIFNIAAWNGLVLFGLREMPAGRGAILAYTMPLWATLISLVVLNERLSWHKVLGLVLGMAAMALLVVEDIAAIGKSPFGAAMILGAAIAWGVGVVMLRTSQPPISKNALAGWMTILGWIPLTLATPFLDEDWIARIPSLSGTAWFAILYNIILAGTLAQWAWFTLARTLPVAVSSMSSLPVPVVGIFAGMLLLGERPGAAEWIALALVVAALFAVLWPGRVTQA